MRKLFVGSLVILSFVLLSASAWAVAISSATVDYTKNTVTINGFGFGTRPVVYLNAPVPNATYFKNYLLTCTVQTNSKTSQTITASLNAYTTGLPAGTYELIVVNPGVGAARYELTCGAASGADISALTTRFTNLSTSKTGIEGALSSGLSTANGNIGSLQTATANLPIDEQNISNLQTSIKTAFSNISGVKAAKDPAIMQAALLQWYPQTFTGNGLNSPGGVAFDGANIWAANGGSNTVSVINAATGKPASFSPVTVGTGPDGIAFDGTNMWVANGSDGTVSVINAATGQLATGLTTNPIHVGNGPDGIAFDGTNVWVVNNGSNTVSVIDDSTGLPSSINGGNPIPVGSVPMGIAFDGANIWVVNNQNDYVTKLLASNGSLVGNYSVGSVGANPYAVAFDGANIWVVNSIANTVAELKASDGSLVNTFNVGSYPTSVAFDGANIWVVNHNGNSVTELNATGAVVKTVNVGTNPYGIAFDGANMWVTNQSGNSVTRIPAR